MNHEQNLEKIRKAYWMVIPNDDYRKISGFSSAQFSYGLADVLMAIGDKGLISMNIIKSDDVACVSFIWDLDEPIEKHKHFVWDLKESLDKQTPETILFLSQLLP